MICFEGPRGSLSKVDLRRGSVSRFIRSILGYMHAKCIMGGSMVRVQGVRNPPLLAHDVGFFNIGSKVGPLLDPPPPTHPPTLFLRVDLLDLRWAHPFQRSWIRPSICMHDARLDVSAIACSPATSIGNRSWTIALFILGNSFNRKDIC